MPQNSTWTGTLKIDIDGKPHEFADQRMACFGRAIARSQSTNFAWLCHSGEARQKTGKTGVSVIGMALSKKRACFCKPLFH